MPLCMSYLYGIMYEQMRLIDIMLKAQNGRVLGKDESMYENDLFVNIFDLNDKSIRRKKPKSKICFNKVYFFVVKLVYLLPRVLSI